MGAWQLWDADVRSAMEAARADLAIYRGANCDATFSFVDDTDTAVPFPAGSKAYLAVRAAAGVEPPWCQFTSDDAGAPLVVEAEYGLVTLALTPAMTAAIAADFDRQTGVFDLLVGTYATGLERALQGTVYIQQAITQVPP